MEKFCIQQFVKAKGDKYQLTSWSGISVLLKSSIDTLKETTKVLVLLVLFNSNLPLNIKLRLPIILSVSEKNNFYLMILGSLIPFFLFKKLWTLILFKICLKENPKY